MNSFRRLLLVAVAVALCGCYHATIETSLEPSLRTIEDSWADAWVLGLVSPSTVETAEKCPDGVAKIETKLSFLNQLVGFLTIGIYTPMSIKVTCAAGGSGSALLDARTIEIEEGASDKEKQRAFQLAATLSAGSGEPVLVRF